MKRITALVIFAVVLAAALAGCAENKDMTARYEGDTLIVENARPAKTANQAYNEMGGINYPQYFDLDDLETDFKRTADFHDAVIVKAEKGKSTSYYTKGEKNGQTLTELTVKEVLWSSSEEYRELKSFSLDEPFFYKQDENGNLEFCLGGIPVSIFLDDGAEYYILYLRKVRPDAPEREKAVYGENWYLFAGFRVDKSIFSDVVRGKEATGFVGLYPKLYRQVYYKYVIVCGENAQ